MEENKKYHLDENDTTEVKIGNKTYTLYRVIADCEIKNSYATIKKGQKGGYIFADAERRTLATDDISWVDENSLVGPGCYVCNGAYVENSILLHDVRVAGVACVKDSQINPIFRSAIEAEALVFGSYVLGDLNMTGQTKFFKSKLSGRLELADEVDISNCEVRTTGSGISAVGRGRYHDYLITGSGLLGIADSVKISDKEFAKA